MRLDPRCADFRPAPDQFANRVILVTGAGDDADALCAKVEAFRPAILAFTAKRPAQVFFRAVLGRRSVAYGLQDLRLGDTGIYVLPSPSGLAVRWWNPSFWHELGALHRAALAARGAPPPASG